MKKIIGGILAVIVVLGLSACFSGSSNSAQSQTPTLSLNEEACQSFEATTKIVKNERTDMEGDKLVAEFDVSALAASGDVKSRIENLMSNLPKPIAFIYLFFNVASRDYDANVLSVVRACEADNNLIYPYTLDIYNP